MLQHITVNVKGRNPPLKIGYNGIGETSLRAKWCTSVILWQSRCIFDYSECINVIMYSSILSKNFVTPTSPFCPSAAPRKGAWWRIQTTGPQGRKNARGQKPRRQRKEGTVSVILLILKNRGRWIPCKVPRPLTTTGAGAPRGNRERVFTTKREGKLKREWVEEQTGIGNSRGDGGSITVMIEA